MKNTKILLTVCIILLSILFTNQGFSQENIDSTISEKKEKSYFKVGFNYLSNAVYYGRKDSAVMPYIRSNIAYHHKSGIYIGGAISYLASENDNRIDLFSLDGGYSFQLGSKFSGDIYASKYFYSLSSYTVSSELKGASGLNINYDPGIVMLSSGIDFLFSEQIDFSINPSISRAFYLGTDDKQYTINPTLNIFLGTQNFYQLYYKNRKFPTNNKGRGRGKNKPASTGTILETKDNSRFTLLSYELSLPITYDSKRWGVYFIPTYAIPTNSVLVQVAGSSNFEQEKLKNIFFGELGGYFKF